MGLVVECEYSLALLGAGAAFHVPRTLYFKRVHDGTVLSASRERMLQPVEDRRAGWLEHDRRMQHLLAAALEDMGAGAQERMLFQVAKESALLRRFQQFVAPLLGEDEFARAEAALARLGPRPAGHGAQIASDLHLVCDRHWRAADQPQKADLCTRASWEACATFASVLAHAQSLHRENRQMEALERAVEAKRIGHLDDTRPALLLIEKIYSKLGW
jgi:hypothetical protein